MIKIEGDEEIVKDPRDDMCTNCSFGPKYLKKPFGICKSKTKDACPIDEILYGKDDKMEESK